MHPYQMTPQPSQDPWGPAPQQAQLPAQYPSSNPGYPQHAPSQPQPQPQPQPIAYQPPTATVHYVQAPYAPPQYSQSLYGQPGRFPGLPVANPPRRSRTPLFGGVAVVVVLAVVALVVINPFRPSLTGYWYGAASVSQQGVTASPAGFVLDLTQNGNTLSGTGQACYDDPTQGVQTYPMQVTGTVDGSHVHMTWTISGTSQSVSVDGTYANGTLTSGFDVSGFHYSSGMKRGQTSDFTAMCSHLMPFTPNQ